MPRITMIKDPLPINEIRKLVAYIHNRFGVDYSDYAMLSFNRRVVYVMDRYRIRDVNALTRRFEEDKLFFPRFVKDLTVNTTEMFRDPEMWRYLRSDVLPQLMSRKTVRIWHAACSSGEEVYSMAILLNESNWREKTKLFASDINQEVLEKAQKGIFSEKRLATNRENYHVFSEGGNFEDYYTLDAQEGNQLMDTGLLKDVRFFQHDLTRDSSIGRFDLILARNILIYFNKDLQNKVLELLHQSLSVGGYLVLGSKETLRWSSVANLFSEGNREEKIFKKLKD